MVTDMLVGNFWTISHALEEDLEIQRAEAEASHQILSDIPVISCTKPRQEAELSPWALVTVLTQSWDQGKEAGKGGPRLAG